MNQLGGRGINLLGARNASLRAPFLKMPAPIVDVSFKYSNTVTDRYRRGAGGVLNDYVMSTTRSI